MLKAKEKSAMHLYNIYYRRDVSTNLVGIFSLGKINQYYKELGGYQLLWARPIQQGSSQSPGNSPPTEKLPKSVYVMDTLGYLHVGHNDTNSFEKSQSG